MNLRRIITESIDLLQAHTECAHGGIPLPDKELKNLRKTHTGWAYDTLNGSVEHNTFGQRDTSRSYISYANHNGQLHKIDGPAVIHANGSKTWYTHGIQHGALEKWPDGTIEHWWGNQKLDRETFKKHFKGVD